MKRVKPRRKNLRISNPIGFSLFIAGCLLALRVIAVIITLAVGYGEDAVRYVQEQIQGTVEVINEQPTFSIEPSKEPEVSGTPAETPKVGTPAPSDTPTPEPIGNLEDTPEPTPEHTHVWYDIPGITIIHHDAVIQIDEETGEEIVVQEAYDESVPDYDNPIGQYCSECGETIYY